MPTRKLSRLRLWWIILRKEVTDNLRDRRTLTTLSVSIIITPLLMFGLIWFTEKTVKEETDLANAKPVELPVVGAKSAPNLMNWLRQNNIKVIDAPSDPEAAIEAGTYRTILLIPDDYTTRFREGKTAPLTLLHDSSISGLEKIGFATTSSALQAYSRQVGAMRLTARGIDPGVVRAIQVNISDIARPEAKAGQLLSMLPYLIVMFIMAGGMYLAIDSTAGEREKGSLEPLITQPVERSTILLAKLSATIVFSGLTLLLMLIGLAIAFKYMPIESVSVSVGIFKVAKIFIFCLPMVFLGSALMVLLASFTKSHKEAQSYLSMVMLVPTLPLIMLGFLSPEPSISNMWIPSLSHGLIIIETIKGDYIPLPLLGLSALVSTLFAGALTWLAVKLYSRERILG